MTGFSRSYLALPYLALYNLLQWAGWLCALTQCFTWAVRTRQLQGIYEEAGMGRTVSMLSGHPVFAAKAYQPEDRTERDLLFCR